MRSLLVVDLPTAVEILTPLVGASVPPVRLVTARTGSEAVQLMRAAAAVDPFDLALLNSNLPDLTWRELTRLLSAASPETPLVVAISPAQEPEAGRIERLGHRVLLRPVVPSSLSRVVERYIPATG